MKPTPGDPRFFERWTEVSPFTDKLDQATILLTDHHHPITEELLGKAHRVKYVVSPNTGHTHLRFDPEAHGIQIISLRGETLFLSEVRSVAEFTISLMLRLCRPLDGEIGSILCNKRLGIVGFGRIGKQLSIMASGFGMQISHVDKDSPEWSWNLLFQRSDFISIHLPECSETRGKIGKKLLSLMKPSSYLINTARPSVLDETALAQLLAEEKIKGAALDVSDQQWIDFPQVIVSPHVAGFTLEDRVKTDEFCLEKLKSALGPRRVRESVAH